MIVSVSASCDRDKGSSADASYIQCHRFGSHRSNEVTPDDTTVALLYHDRYSCAAATLLDSRLRNITDVMTPDLKTRYLKPSNFEE